jgi:hypothetical protein
MLDYRLDKQKLAERRAARRKALNGREVCPINAATLLAMDSRRRMSPMRYCLTPDAIRTYFKRYSKEGWTRGAAAHE